MTVSGIRAKKDTFLILEPKIKQHYEFCIILSKAYIWGFLQFYAPIYVRYYHAGKNEHG
jgi:hypothetical protein